MGLRSFFAAAERVEIGNQELGFLKIDATLAQTHSIQAFVSTNQIEDGSNISDHYKRSNDKLQLECVISDVGISFNTSLSNIVTSSSSKIGGGIGSKVGNLGSVIGSAGVGILSSDLIGSGGARVEDAFRKLNEFIDKASLLTVKTKLKTYDSMMITDINLPKTKEINDSLKFTISFSRVRVVNSKDIPIPETTVKGAMSHSATSKTDLGKQKLQEVKPEEQGRASSALFKIFGF